MCQRSAAQVGVDLLDAGVPAVGLLGLDQAERAVGQHRVVVAAINSTCAPLSWPAPSAPALPLLGVLVVGLRRLTRRTSSRAVMCSFFAAAGERGQRHCGDLGVADDLPGLFVPYGVGILDRRPGVVADAGDRPPLTAKRRLRLGMPDKRT